MAKRIVLTSNEVQRAAFALKDFQIEHVLVSYPEHTVKGKTTPAKKFIIVKNVDIQQAKKVIKDADITICAIRGARHFAHIANSHVKGYYQPTFQCTCRHCGQKFNSNVKTAVWCSDKCYKAFRQAKKNAKNSQ